MAFLQDKFQCPSAVGVQKKLQAELDLGEKQRGKTPTQHASPPTAGVEKKLKELQAELDRVTE